MTAWHSPPFVSPGLRPPPLPHCAERHAVLRLQVLLAGKQEFKTGLPTTQAAVGNGVDGAAK